MDDLFDAFEGDDNVELEEVENLEEEGQPDKKLSRVRAAANDLLESMARGDESAKRPRLDDDVIEVVDGAGEGEEEEEDECDQQNRVTVHEIQTGENCTHEVALPPGVDFAPLNQLSTTPAKQYPFQLDAFQREAILCIENNQSVLVSAHTSAGKTVVALYAIAQALRDKQRVIYTSPIKALSNQKYRELEEEFGDVGLMTGDVTINADASCLVMTTEILRSMLYRGSQMMREVGWVVFDEIHYMRDKERGVVWEETIILLPSSVHHVFLSATIPNAKQFAEWVCWLHSQPCHVVYTDYRPTPLQHFIFPAGGSGLYEVVNQQGVFREDKFAEAMSGLAGTGDAAKGGIMRGRRGGSKGQSEANVVKIIRTVKERDMIPCIIFSFSRKECEAYAMSLKDMDFNNDIEKGLVKEIFKNAVDLLSDEDRKLPQIGQVLPLLQRGIGIHHSGLLPILKETVEILFGEGLLKTLFATETFSMGLNMPARTVLFTSARKFDGKDNRWITSGEYIQMAGRAGRRGKDDRGLVILMVDQQISSDEAKQIVKGATDPLNSQFRLTYNMVLNLMRVEDITPEFMLERSFHQFQNYAAIPGIKEKIRAKEAELDAMKIEGETELAGFFDMERQMEMLKASIRKTVLSIKYVVPFLHPGRLFKIKTGSRDFGWGVLIKHHRKVNPEDAHEMVYVLDMLIALDPSSAADVSNPGSLKPPQQGGKAVWELVPMTIECVDDISAVRLKLPTELTSREARDQVARMVKEVFARHPVLPGLDPVKDQKITDAAFKAQVDKLADIEKRHASHPLRQRDDFEKIAKEFRDKEASARELKELRDELKRVKSLLHLNELSNRKRVLRRLGYAGDGDAIQQKGRVACEVSAADELLLTEMIFGNVFEELDVPQVAALLSCFVFQENASPAKMAEELAGCLRQIQVYARRIAKISHECRLDIIEDEYVESFKPAMMDVVKNWVNGMSFGEILKTTDIFEGSIIRCFRRLEELLREMVGAAKAVQNTDLEAKFEMARTKIKRDIVFAAIL
ncbi:mtr-4 [Pristionchus pacificus]|uniref:Mtr-4 n=1 Tax=Pristionchus pacificus TaxID=54126 RepID=A0A2A6B3M6_PRIPA|nr:mtr-4 [Pristionchus pacificus]|eukprot:PDM60486.1 mtr-4 [Pristionchus pacificus]